MVRVPLLLALPRLFSAKHVYTLSSFLVAFRISRLPSNKIEILGWAENTLSMLKPEGGVVAGTLQW